MARQPFRQGKSDGTMAEAGAGGGDGDGMLNFKATGDSTPTTGTKTQIPCYPCTGTNSFSNQEPFYHYHKSYCIPMYSGSGGIISGLNMYAGSETAQLDTQYSVAVYNAGDDGHPSTILSSVVAFNPQSAYGSNFMQFSSNITLAAKTWYWIVFLGLSETAGGNVNMRTFSSYRANAMQYWSASSNMPCMQYWNTRIEGGALPSSFTVSSGSAEWRSAQTNDMPFILMRFVTDGNGEWA